ncbi:T7SS effector LXG polymorphic toxin [Rummeliibacillus pycnus]|uniref:T7SS effector LXG polymorphic toxin n=1 Tax=Rummeliibacillus pycnus TaxID=101070 RepID=UPI003D278B45
MTKVLDVTGLQNGIEETLKSLKNKQNEIAEVETAVQGIIALEDAFKGKSGDAVRNYYKEVHLPFISYYKDFIEDYESKLKSMDKELQALESASNGKIVELYLKGELKSSLQNSANHTITLTDETNKTILSVQDIVALPQLSDTFFLEEVTDAKKQISDTIEKIHQFDYNQSNVLEQLSNDVSNMQHYIDGIKSLSKSGKLQLENYKSGTLNKYHLDDWLMTEEGSTCSREDTKEIEKLKKKLLNASTIDEYLKIAEEIGDANLDEDQKQIVTMLKTAKGIKDGLYKSGKDFVEGIIDLFTTNPIETIESTLKAVVDPETYKYLAKSIADSFERDVINGDAESRARWISYALGTVFTSVVGTKGAGAVTKAGMATTKAAAKAGVSTVKGALKETPIPNLFPYAPQHQLAGANLGVVPFNTVNSVGLKDRLLSMAKVETKGSKGAKGTRNVKYLDDVPRIKEIEVNFKKNVKHDSEEFVKQLKDQEKGMNELTVDEYLKNRDRYIAEGRAIEGNAAQKMARQEALKDKIAELRKQGLSRADATKQASEWMETKAALHNPDQIAGGRADIIGGLGDKRVNSSIGSQWKYRIDVVDEQIREIAKNMSPEKLKNTYLNVKLTQ